MITEARETSEDNRRIYTKSDPKIRTYHIVDNSDKEIGRVTVAYYKASEDKALEIDTYIVGFSVCTGPDLCRFNKKVGKKSDKRYRSAIADAIESYKKDKGNIEQIMNRLENVIKEKQQRLGNVAASGRVRTPRAYKNTERFTMPKDSKYKDIEETIRNIFSNKYLGRPSENGYHLNVNNVN